MVMGIVALAVLAAVFGPQLWARSCMARFNRVAYFSGHGADLARLLLDRCGLEDVPVEWTTAGDHYDPQHRIVRLSRRNCGRRTLTAVVVAAHEVGHAIQDRAGYRPFALRNRLVLAAARIERLGAAVILLVPVLAAVN